MLSCALQTFDQIFLCCLPTLGLVLIIWAFVQMNY